MARMRGLARLTSVPAYFCFKIAAAIVLLKLCASFLTVGGYAEFAQLVQLGTVLNLLAVGGAQNGLIRQSAAAGDDEHLAAIHSAALMIWGAAVARLIVPLCLASGAVSSVLIGDRSAWPSVIAITFLSLTGGAGQIWCSILSGKKKVATSLLAQASGLFAGTAGAVVFIVRGEPQAAATAFAAGPLLTLLVAGTAVRRVHIRTASRAEGARQILPLLRYSGAFGVTSGYLAITLFALRSFYREQFGSIALGYWIAANRISDMSTQLLGLFIIQFYVSHVAVLDDGAERRAFILRCWAAGTALMTTAFLVFSFAGPELVTLFLSPAFVPAVPVIRTYMLGDILTVWASLAMFTAFARGRPGRYAAIEIGTISLMAAIAMGLMASGNPRAPQLAYVGAYAVTAILVTIVFLSSFARSQGSPSARKTAFTA